METAGIKERLGSVGNQFAVTTILAFLISLPFSECPRTAPPAQPRARTAPRPHSPAPAQRRPHPAARPGSAAKRRGAFSIGDERARVRPSPCAVFAKEGGKFGAFLELIQSGTDDGNKVLTNLISSGMYFYLYNELATMTIKKTSATTQSVANTAKRVIVIVGAALAFGESLDPMKMLGCSIGIGGVFLYSLVK
jgi:drug/metabolite transporter (DMT)-like permease